MPKRQRPAGAATGPEMALTNAVVDLLHTVGAWAMRVNSGAIPIESKGKRRLVRLAPEGTSDVLGCLPPNGTLIAVETKIFPGEPTPLQSEFLAWIREAGGIGLVAYGLDDVARVLADRGLIDGGSWPWAEVTPANDERPRRRARKG